jgi:hypothetical protein
MTQRLQSSNMSTNMCFRFNPEPDWKAAVAIDQSINLAVSQDYQSCMNDEESARRELVQSWSKYNAQEQARCIGKLKLGDVQAT